MYTSLFGFTLDPHQERLHRNRASSCCQASSSGVSSSSSSPSLPNVSAIGDAPSGTHERSEQSSMPTLGSGSSANKLRQRMDAPRLSSGQAHISDDSAAFLASAKSESEQWQNFRRNTEPVGAVRHGLPSRGGPLPADSANHRLLAPTLLARTGWPRRFLHWGQQKQPPNIITCCQACLHSTSTSVISGRLLGLPPNVVRREVECLWADFLVRIKQLIFNSVVCAYYAGFIPMQFVQVR